MPGPVDAAATAIFVLTYGAVALGRVPGLRLDRAGIALLGAALMVAIGAMPLSEAYGAVDWNTIALLLGAMIVSAHLKLSGFFALATEQIARRVRGPIMLLALIGGAAAVLSGFLVNDTVCVALTPLVIDLVLALKRRPLPYLLALAMGSNIGSVATITGNPQNIIIGGLSKISFPSFTEALAPVAVLSLLCAGVLLVLSDRAEFFGTGWSRPAPDPPRVHRRLLIWAAIVTAGMIAGFFLAAPPAKPALIAGAVLLASGGLKPARIYRQIDWPLLVMFCGLFVVTAAMRGILFTPATIAALPPLDRPVTLAAVAGVLSNLVSNVPAVLVIAPLIEPLAHPRTAWLVLAMASTLAGNLTLLGSVANLIVAERAAAAGFRIGFWDYTRIGIPVTLASLAFGTALLARF